jgi:hypothetical protein
VHWLGLVGLSLTLAGLALALRHHVLAARYAGRHEARSATAQRGHDAGLDWSHGVLWFGLLLLLAGQIVQQLQRGAPVPDLVLSLTAGATAAFTLGIFIGRLLLRRQWRTAAGGAPDDR